MTTYEIKIGDRVYECTWMVEGEMCPYKGVHLYGYSSAEVELARTKNYLENRANSEFEDSGDVTRNFYNPGFIVTDKVTLIRVKPGSAADSTWGEYAP